MDVLNNRFPPLLIAGACALLMWLVTPVGESSLSGVRVVIALLVVLLGMAICLAGVLNFRRASTTVNPLAPQQVSTLVETGIYRHSRNPMYLGFALMLLGWAIALGSLPAVFGVAGFILYINRFQIAPEERALQQRFGNAFADYRVRVRRWI